MIEHVSIPVSNVKKAKVFYAKALKPLGYKAKYDWGDAYGFSEAGHTSFIIDKEKKVVPMHIAFVYDADGNNVEAVWYDPKREK